LTVTQRPFSLQTAFLQEFFGVGHEFLASQEQTLPFRQRLVQHWPGAVQLAPAWRQP
jgi:hypothetical protein